MLRNADHVADHLGCGQPRDQTIFGNLEGEVFAPFIRVKSRLAVWSIFTGFIGHHVILATDTIGKRIVIDRRGG
jgi:hypothetical protein